MELVWFHLPTIVVHIFHVWPRINVIRISAAYVYGRCLRVDARNKWYSEHLQLWGEIEGLFSNDSVEIAVLPLDAKHS